MNDDQRRLNVAVDKIIMSKAIAYYSIGISFYHVVS